MTLADVVGQLYGVPPEQFVPRRKALATALRTDDRALADEVSRLPKPTAAAWAVNHFARARAEELAALLDLGGQLRAAQGDLDAGRLRELADRAHGVVSGMVRSVADAAAHAGTPLGDAVQGQVEQTLRAAMADERAAEAVRAGVLTRPLAPGGFGPVDLTGAVAVEPAGDSAPPRQRRHLSVVPPPARAPRTKQDAKAEKTRRHEVRISAERALDELEQARVDLAAALTALQRAEQDRDEAAARVDDLRAQLHQGEEQAATATAAVRAARAVQERAQRHERAAMSAAERAREELDALDR